MERMDCCILQGNCVNILIKTSSLAALFDFLFLLNQETMKMIHDLTFLMNIHCVHERCTCNGRVLVPKVNANIRPSITSIVGQPILKDIQRLLMKRTSHIMWRILILVPTKSDGVEETTSGIFLNFHHVHIVH